METIKTFAIGKGGGLAYLSLTRKQLILGPKTLCKALFSLFFKRKMKMNAIKGGGWCFMANVFNISLTVTIYCAHWHFLVCCCWLVGLPLWCRVWEIGQDWGLNGGPTPHHHPTPQQHRHQQQDTTIKNTLVNSNCNNSRNSNCNSTVQTSNLYKNSTKIG